ncbi:hypothetical protein Ddye_031509 [Dipteronia dyeriana]|uniref:Uncharacterized protein n=1 Tax=Dipteronia dyeriana TaxID=168575 RepID=A0AAD9TJ31_9ROSI|nr:hypothetical protein Ddye_031509 [Dipteronia dyeriana]
MSQATDTENHVPHHQVLEVSVDVPGPKCFDDDGRLKRTDRFKNLFHSILETMNIIQLLQAPPPAPANHGAAISVDHGLAISVDNEAAAEHHPEPEPEASLLADYDRENLDWAVKMIGFCLPPAVEIGVQFLKTDQSHELQLAFHFLSLTIILSFNSLFLSKFIAPKFPEKAKLLERVGVFLAVTAIYIAITIPLPTWLRCVTWIVFVVSCIAMAFCHGSFYKFHVYLG